MRASSLLAIGSMGVAGMIVLSMVGLRTNRTFAFQDTPPVASVPAQSLPPDLPLPSPVVEKGPVELPVSTPSAEPGGVERRVDPVNPSALISPEDPEKAARDFVDKTRQAARTNVKMLQDESEALRARLKKVDAALIHWQTLLGALDATGKGGEVLESIPNVSPDARK